MFVMLLSPCETHADLYKFQVDVQNSEVCLLLSERPTRVSLHRWRPKTSCCSSSKERKCEYFRVRTVGILVDQWAHFCLCGHLCVWVNPVRCICLIKTMKYGGNTAQLNATPANWVTFPPGVCVCVCACVWECARVCVCLCFYACVRVIQVDSATHSHLTRNLHVCIIMAHTQRHKNK